MKNIASAVNLRPLSKGCTPNGNKDGSPLEIYRGWVIRNWTGWKGNTCIIEDGDVLGPVGCAICGKGFMPGDIVVSYSGSDDRDHINCSTNKLKGRIIGQWLAHKGTYGDQYARYAYASVPGGEGEYKRGANFIIEVQPGQIAYTPETAQEVLELAREDGLKRLKAAIDAIENAAA
jgi:hypothetical protein